MYPKGSTALRLALLIIVLLYSCEQYQAHPVSSDHEGAKQGVPRTVVSELLIF